MKNQDWPHDRSYEDVVKYCEENDLLPILAVKQFYEYEKDVPPRDEMN